VRSELIYRAMTYVSNRFLLTRLASTATRRLHRPNNRIEDTANDVFERFARASPLAAAPCTHHLQWLSRSVQGEPHPPREEQSVA
jgi:hypothetical protein